jgi:hypothetical protein
MTFYFTIIQYVPDPVANERINVGVMVFGEGKVFTRFVKNWTHIRRFGGEDISFLRDFAADWESVAQTKLAGDHLNEENLLRMTREWGDSIQFTPPLPSTTNPEVLLSDMAKRVLRGGSGAPPNHRTKSQVARHVHRSMESAIAGALGQEAVTHLLATERTIWGEATYHNPDLVVRNGSPLACLFCLSFNISAQESAMATLMASVCSINDIKKKIPWVECAVIASISENSKGDLIQRASRLVEGAGGAFVPEATEELWVHKFVVDNLVPYVEAHGRDAPAGLLPPALDMPGFANAPNREKVR